jgi:hypothetical protein
MQKRKEKNDIGKSGLNADEIVCSNQLLAAIRQQMAKRRSGPKEKRPKDLKIEEKEY